MNDKKSYYAIIPAKVRYDNRIIPNAKLLYGEITALTNEKGYCWASNAYFAKLYEVSNQSVSAWIKNLSDGGYIKTKYLKNEAYGQRLIYINETPPYFKEDVEKTYLKDRADIEECNKSYYAIVPAAIRYDIRLTPNAKLLYGEITALTNEKGYCWASNAYFAKLYGVAGETVSEWIKNLSCLKYINTKYVSEGNAARRLIYINGNIVSENISKTELETEECSYIEEPKPFEKNDSENIKDKTTALMGVENLIPPTKKTEYPPVENFKHNNTYNNTVNRESEKEKSDDFNRFISRLILSFDSLTNRHAKCLSDMPALKTLDKQKCLLSAFDNRRYDALECIEFAEKRARAEDISRRWFKFLDSLYIYLRDGEGKKIKKRLDDFSKDKIKMLDRESIAKRERLKQEKESIEAERLEDDIRLGAKLTDMDIEEYRKSLENFSTESFKALFKF